MKMVSVSKPRTELKDFIELVLMWHCAGDIPMNRPDTTEFIESERYVDFLQSLQFWCRELGLQVPARSDVVKTLHLLYNHK